MDVELRRNLLRFWLISSGHVMLVRVLVLTVFALVQSLSQLFTFPPVRLSACVFVVGGIQTLFSLGRWQLLPRSRNATSGESRSLSLASFWAVGNEVRGVWCCILWRSFCIDFSIFDQELWAWVSIFFRNLLVVNSNGLSVDDWLIRPLHTAVHLCMSLVLLLTG